ncbi:hypothetical protein BC567DRAFT_55513 [Phyllosticta citribraziliensis]
MMEEIVIRLDGPRKRRAAGEVHVGPRVGWQIQQRNFRLGASVPIGMHDNRLLLLPLPSSTPARLSSPTSFLFSFPVRRRSFHLRAPPVAGFTLSARLSCHTLFLHDHNNTLDRPLKCPPPRKTPCADTFNSNTRLPTPFDPPRRPPAHLFWLSETQVHPNNTSPPPLVSPWPTRLWSAVAAISTSRPP